jgi:hypothetical protein
MLGIVSQISSVFNPQVPEIKDYKAAIKAVDTQQTARITKIALFTFTAMVTMATVAFIEGGAITWPLALVAFAVAVVVGGLFVRLNMLDSHYIKWITDEMRESFITNELERIFHSTDLMNCEDLTKSLKDVNRLVGVDVFNKEHIYTILQLNREAAKNENLMTLAETIADQGISINFSSGLDWTKERGFGLNPIEYTFSLNWSPIPGQTVVTFTSAEKTDQPVNSDD